MEIKRISTESFNEEVLQADKPVLVDFYADWCGPCTMMAPIMEEVAKAVENEVLVAKINIDENQDLAMQYRIESIPTLVLFKKGTIEKTLVGVRSKEEILEAIR